MKITEKEIQGLLPNLKGLVEPRVEQKIYESFRRLYDILNFRLANLDKTIDTKLQAVLATVDTKQNELTSLIGSLSQPLVGDDTIDNVLQSVVSSNGELIADKLNANGTILDVDSIIEGEFLRRIGNAIKSGVPVGTTTLTEGTLNNVEDIIYTTPANHRTKLRHLFLYNNSAGILPVDILAKDPSSNIIFADNFNMASLEKRLETLNIILPANYTFRGFSSAIGAIEYTLFGIEEPLV